MDVMEFLSVTTAEETWIREHSRASYCGFISDQIRSSPPSILTLLEIRRHYPEVFSNIEVFVDCGIRRGTDIVKALCLGAKAVGMGRPFLYSLTYGQEGVEHFIDSK
jgi:isopentenyl diphosphate isomerase/L-lactate dehydrogenase-like FMN-dependent dehydrogenase